MKLNNDLIRELLLYIEENGGIIWYWYKWIYTGWNKISFNYFKWKTEIIKYNFFYLIILQKKEQTCNLLILGIYNLK